MAKRRKRRAIWWSDWRTPPTPSRGELEGKLAPLTSRIERVDAIVSQIARGDGCVRDMLALEQLLKEPFTLPSPTRTEVALIQPANIRAALRALDYGLHLEVHTVDGRFPSYLLCRISTAWDTPDTILDELHVSPRNDFFPDERFVVLLRTGRSRVFLRLSAWRHVLQSHMCGTWDQDTEEALCDEALETVARVVLAAAWYEDQRLPFRVADVFHLVEFRSALELVAFILGSDLYQVAAALRDDDGAVVAFFEHAYKNHQLANLLRHLSHSSRADLTDIEEFARSAFVELNRCFAAFLSTCDALQNLEPHPLYEVVLGCFYDLKDVADRSTWLPKLDEAVQTVEKESVQCTRDLLSAVC